MCGFAGIISKNEISKVVLDKMGEKIDYRGPDKHCSEIINFNKFNIGLVHRRLSILDLSESGSQPMWDKNNRICIVYNGEVYNFNKLKSECTAKYSSTFNTSTDTEVIIELYKNEGISFVSKLNGMFAFFLIDIDKGKCFLVRDRVGVKPFFYGWHNNDFYFGSELKSFFGNTSFSPKVSINAVSGFLQYGYVPGNISIYEGIKKVQPGTYIEFNFKSNSTKTHTYWVLENSIKRSKSLSFKKAKVQFKDLLKSSFSYRMVSDVPVGVFLSGGYDSTLLTGILTEAGHKLDTFTIGFDDQNIDESKHAKEISKHFKTNHHEFICKPEDALNYVNKIPFIYDEPFGDPSAIPTMMVSDKASDFVKVVLSADGGDEIFGGYDKHKWVLNSNKLKKPIIKNLSLVALQILGHKIFEKLAKAINLRNYLTRITKLKKILNYTSIVDSMSLFSQYIPDFEIASWVKISKSSENEFFKNHKLNSNIDSVDEMLYVDIKTHLPDQIMTKVDRATMSASIEGREPLLDYRIIEKSFSLKIDFKIDNKGNTKKILKSIVWDMVPKEMIERPKQGFVIPLAKWLRGPLRDLVEEHISEDKLDYSIFNVSFIIDFKNRFMAGENLSERKLWHILMYQLWQQKWISNKIV